MFLFGQIYNMFDDKRYTYRTLPYTGKSSHAIFSNDGTTPSVTMTVNNVVVQGNVRNNTIVAFPYGFCSVPTNNTQMVILNTGILGQSPIAIGSVAPIQSNIVCLAGESFNYSNSWILKYSNTGLLAYFRSTPAFVATLPNGEFIGKILTDIITSLQETRVAAGLSPDPTLEADQTFINNGNYLLNQNAMMP